MTNFPPAGSTRRATLRGSVAALVGAWLIAACAQAGGITRVPLPSDAVTWALPDAERGAEKSGDYRYFLVDEADPLVYGTASYACNLALSHAPSPFFAVEVVEGSAGHLLRIDCAKLAPFKADRLNLFQTWERLTARNYYFHSINPDFIGRGLKKTDRPADKSTDKAEVWGGRQAEAFLRFPDGLRWVRVGFIRQISDAVVLLRWEDGREFQQPAKYFRWQDRAVQSVVVDTPHVADEIVSTIPSLHLNGLDSAGLHRYRRLQFLTGSETPIMRLDQFFSIALRQSNDGLYYDFRNIKRNAGDGKTDEERWLDSVGRSSVRREERSVMWRRRLNDQPAAFEWFGTGNTQSTLGPGFVFMTRDFKRRKTDATVHPIYNVLNYKHDATEAFGTLPNGMIEFTLFSGAGELQDVAPPDIAIDNSPRGHSPVEVEVAHSCIRCHASSDMYHPFENHAHSLLESKLDIFDDTASKESIEETIVKIASLYGGNPMDVVRFARLTHARATIVATGGVFGINPVPKVCDRLAQIFDGYYFAPVTPRTAALELGWKCATDKEAQSLLKQIIPDMPLNDFGFSPESPAIRALKFHKEGMADLPLREDWEREYSMVAVRVLNARKHWPKAEINVKPSATFNTDLGYQLAP